ncbi:fungal-specific transcription factor domain-containing protein [Lipomyces kononenkoae]|uniref:Fungal-specific transcription factor domain-containing protein n=1 Tax=Lipomyces kononenkoae TaxID=34357 RepID=A0ACC3SQR1_LIPKO
MSLVDGAFKFHNATTPGISVTNAIPGGRQLEVHADSSDKKDLVERAGMDFAGDSTMKLTNVIPSTMRSLTRSSRSAVTELVSLFPEYEVAALLVDTYFDRVHWFMLIFHQDEFRRRWQKLYRPPSNLTEVKYHDIGFISTFLMVITIGLQYTGVHRRRLLTGHNVDHEKLKERILSAIRAKLLDIVALGSLEAVQTCVLLGTYYLFHGSPGLAWPVCGCGLRIAQALNLHRKLPRDESGSLHAISLRNQNETRKRCWWAIYEIETFCSMSYGYPHSIKDADCDVEPLDPSAKSQFVQSPTSFNEPLQCDTTLLSYKYFMSKLSVLTKAALAELYCIGPVSGASPGSPASAMSGLHRKVQKVADFDVKLRQWQAEIPSKLQPQSGARVEVSYSSLDELDRDTGASGPRFESHIFQLQALTLKLAYENARILVHRPLLSYKLVAKSGDQTTSLSTGLSCDHPDPFRLSLQVCRDAALSTSELVSIPVAELISDTYAAAFVGIHTFTAAVTLAILSSIEPLSPQSHEVKSGLHRLMIMQTRLKDRSALAAQSLEILQRLTRHVMEKELSAMLDVSRPMKLSNPVAGVSADGPGVSHVTDRLHIAQQPVAEPNIEGVANLQPAVESGDTADIINGSLSFQYVADPALSQSNYDFDQAISTQMPPFRPELEQTPMSSSLVWLPADDEFPALEQAWIWGLDSFAPPE